MEGPMLSPGPSVPTQEPADHDLPDRFNPCVTDTFLDVPSAEVVVVPWKVFNIFPDILHPNFRSIQGQITYEDDINIFMADPNLQPSKYGYMTEFTQTWVVKLQCEEEVDIIIERLTSRPSLMSVVLTARNIIEDSIEIPMVLFITPESRCIKDIVSKLQRGKQYLRSGKKFSVELDIGPSMQNWGKQVLRREFLSVGGRLCFTSGATFNHVFDWTNIMGCVPCLPCGLVGGTVYRVHRKINYKDEVITDLVGIATLGAKGVAFANQRHAIYLLMQWIKVFKLYYCIDCRCRKALDESHMDNSAFCRCDQRPESVLSFSRNNKVSPLEQEDKGSTSSRNQGSGDSPQYDDATDDDQSHNDDSDDENEEIDNDDEATDQHENRDLSNRTGDHKMPEVEQVDVVVDDKQKVTKENATTNIEHTKPQKKGPNKSKSRRSGRKDKVDDTPGKFAMYKKHVSGDAIDRKKWMVTYNLNVTNPEWKTSMNILNAKRPGGFVQRTVFKYPKKKKMGPARRPLSSRFVEVEFKRDENFKEDQESISDEQGHEPRRRIYLDDGDDEGFYFLEDEATGSVDSDPLGQADLKRFLVHISDPNTRTLQYVQNNHVTHQPVNGDSSV